MRILQRFNKVYYRMLISYILIITISTVIVGFTTYTYFSTRFNEEIENINNMMLDNISKNFENNIVLRINKLCIDLETNQNKNGNFQYFFNHNFIDSYRIQEIKWILQEIASVNSDIIESIALYNKDANIIIGSSSGVTFLSEHDNVLLNNTFSESTVDLNSKFSWIYGDSLRTLFPYDAIGALIYIHNYTSFKPDSNYTGFIKININKALIHSIIEDSLPKESVFSFVSDNSGSLIASVGSPTKRDSDNINNYVNNFSKSSLPKNTSYIDVVDSIKSVVSINLIKYTNWRIVNVIPLNDYYNKTFLVRRNIALVCCISIIFGLLLSALFASKFNNPIDLIIRKIRLLLNNKNFVLCESKNEFNYIDGVIDNLSIKLSELESTIKNNVPIIKHNLIIDLVQNNIKDRNEVDAQLDIIDQEFSCKTFFLAVLTLDSSAGHMAAEIKQLTKYDLIRFIENFEDTLFFSIAAALSNTEIVIISNTENGTKTLFEIFLNKINEYAKINFEINTYAVIGGTTESIMKTCELYQTAKTLQKYHFFLPDATILTNSIACREISHDELPEKLFNDFSIFLNNKNIEGIGRLLDSFIEMIQKGDYSYDQCQQKTLEIIYVLSKYCKTLGASLEDDMIPGLFSKYYSLNDMKQFKELFMKTVITIYEMIAEHEKGQKHIIMESINRYIFDNLHKDISLNILAEMVGLSPNYLSRVYKEDCGITFIEYVMKMKMEKAKDLLASTNLSIEEISKNLGYSGSAYLIKKFRETYGITPSKYRLSIS